MISSSNLVHTVNLGNKEQFDKEQIGVEEPFPLPVFYSLHKGKEHLAEITNGHFFVTDVTHF